MENIACSYTRPYNYEENEVSPRKVCFWCVTNFTPARNQKLITSTLATRLENNLPLSHARRDCTHSTCWFNKTVKTLIWNSLQAKFHTRKQRTIPAKHNDTKTQRKPNEPPETRTLYGRCPLFSEFTVLET